MNIYLGNIQFNETEEKLGYKLSDDDKILWDKYHNHLADLSGMESSFHVFDIPRCIKFKGEEAKNAILKMFTPDKNTNPIGRFTVYEQK
jgi:hypothetical protein